MSALTPSSAFFTVLPAILLMFSPYDASFGMGPSAVTHAVTEPPETATDIRQRMNFREVVTVSAKFVDAAKVLVASTAQFELSGPASMTTDPADTPADHWVNSVQVVNP
jgi:hypothetical protein